MQQGENENDIKNVQFWVIGNETRIQHKSSDDV